MKILLLQGNSDKMLVSTMIKKEENVRNYNYEKRGFPELMENMSYRRLIWRLLECGLEDNKKSHEVSKWDDGNKCNTIRKGRANVGGDLNLETVSKMNS